jgi:sulfur-oxidizing protein SoxY
MHERSKVRAGKTDASRRAFVRILAQGGFGAALSLLGGTALANERNAAAFAARALPAMYKALGIEPGAAASSAIKLTAPDVAENGANVPIDVVVNLPAIERVLLIGEKNAFPLLLDVAWSAPGPAAFDVRIKLGETANVRVIAVSGGQVHTVTREVRVTQGGCAG